MAKLIDILARELKVWPCYDDASVSQDFDKDIAFFEQSEQSIIAGCQSWSGYSDVIGPLTGLKELASDWQTAKVTRAEWQAAVDALNAPKVVEWDGVGLPPVGLIATITDEYPHDCYRDHVGLDVEILAHTDGERGQSVAVYKAKIDGETFYHALIKDRFKPIRTAEQIAAEEREKAVSEMVDTLKRFNSTHEACGMLYDAGYIKP